MSTNYRFRGAVDRLSNNTIKDEALALKSNIAFFNGNYGYTTVESCERVEELTADNANKVIHVSGQQAQVNFQISFRGTLKDGKIIVNYQNEPVECELYDLYMYANAHDFSVILDGDDIVLMSAKCNKLHGLKRQLDFFNNFIDTTDINISVYSSNDNTFITSYSGELKDITKFIQSKNYLRGYKSAWLTDRVTEVTLN